MGKVFTARRMAALWLGLIVAWGPGGSGIGPGGAEGASWRQSRQVRKDSQFPPGVQVIKIKGRTYQAMFLEVWQRINEIYPSFQLKEVNWEEVKKKYAPQAAKAANDDEFHQVLARMVSELKDGHTRVVAPQQGRQGRLPLVLRQANGGWVVVSVAGSRTGEENGVRPGMELVRLNQQPVAEAIERHRETAPGATEAARQLEALDQALRGKPGEAAELTFRTPHGKTVTTRMTYEIPGREAGEPRRGRRSGVQLVRETEFAVSDTAKSALGYRRLPGGWGYIKVSSFQSPPGTALDQALTRLQPMKGLIVDLRGNGGGIMGNGDQLVGRFIDRPIPGGVIVRKNGQKTAMGVKPQGHSYAGPMALLIDEKVASTAEHVAAVLQDAKRAVLVGTTTAGASGNPVVLALPTRAFVQVSSWDHFRPNGERIEGRGVKPDVEVTLDPQAMKGREDPFLKAAIKALSKGGTGS